MIEEIIRHELPIQCLFYIEKKPCYAIVPLHLAVRKLHGVEKVDLMNLKDAKSTVGRWYDEDMERLLENIKDQGMHFPNLRGYEKFDDSWHLDVDIAKGGFLTLVWAEKRTHKLSYFWMPMQIYNEKDKEGKFKTYLSARDESKTGMSIKRTYEPDTVYFSPEKMLKYGKKLRFIGFDPESDKVEVMARCMMSANKHNIAQTILLRNYGVFYHNRLLEVAEKRGLVR